MMYPLDYRIRWDDEKPTRPRPRIPHVAYFETEHGKRYFKECYHDSKWRVRKDWTYDKSEARVFASRDVARQFIKVTSTNRGYENLNFGIEEAAP